MSETLIMDRYTVTSSEWTWNEQFGAWTAVTPRVCPLVPGEYYAITNVANVSEVEFRYEATEACDVSSLIGMPMVAVGNLWSLGLPSNESMYIIGDGGTFNMFVYTGGAIDFQPPDHTFKVHQVVGESGEPEEPEEPDSPENPSASNNAVILSYSQTPIVYENIPKVWLTHPDSTEEDVKLVPFTYGEAVGKSVELDFSTGDMVVDIPAGELVTALTVKKPEDLVPENIADGLYIAGVGPGAYIGNGNNSGSGDNKSGSIVYEPVWIDDVCFWDYDGTLIQHFPVNEAATMTELPEPPTHDGLTFLGWNYTLEQVQTAEYPQDIGAIYIPVDGKTHLHLSVTNASYRAVPLNWAQTVSGGVSIDWGDGTSKTTMSGMGVVKTTHTYSAIGEYDVVITVDEGCVMTLGGGSSTTSFVGGNNSTYRKYLTKLYIGKNVLIGSYGLYSASSIELLTIPNTISSIPDRGISSIDNLRILIIPNSVTELGTYIGNSLGSYIYRYDNLTVSIPESVTAIGAYCCGSSYFNRLVLPRSIEIVPNNVLYNLYLAMRIFIADSVTELGNSSGWGLQKLERFVLPKALTKIGDYFGYQSYALREIVIPDGVTSIGTNFGSMTSITSLVIPKSVASIGSSFLYNAYSVRRIVFEGVVVQSPSTGIGVSELFYLNELAPSSVANGGYYCEIYVQDNAFDAYYNMIGSNYKHRVHRLSEYPGELPKYE